MKGSGARAWKRRLLLSIEAALLIGALVCAGLYVRNAAREARQLRYEREMRDEIRRYSGHGAAE